MNLMSRLKKLEVQIRVDEPIVPIMEQMRLLATGKYYLDGTSPNPRLIEPEESDHEV